jgi:galactokinase
MVWLLREEGTIIDGLEMIIAGNLPRGAGLSSSASLCIAMGRALIAACRCDGLPPEKLAIIAQQVEHRFAGVACGMMDQMVIAAGQPGSAMLLDCRDLNFEIVDIPQDWCILIVQSGVERELVEGAYNARRSECENAARILSLASLRDVDPATADFSRLAPVEAKRARHVVFEIDRTRKAASAIKEHDIEHLGSLLREAHQSMRDLFEASHLEVDRQVDALNAIIGTAGGARMTGGGFGGAIVAIVPASQADRIEDEWTKFMAYTTGSKALFRAFN